MNTTLEQELILAEADAVKFAMSYGLRGNKELADRYTARAARLRQRAAWVRELERNAEALVAASSGLAASAYASCWNALTGPYIPAETAPKPEPLGPPLCEEVRAAGRYCYVTTYRDGESPIKTSLLFKTPELANECARRLRSPTERKEP